MNVGIIGCGLISRAHIDALRQVQGVEIVAVCDSDPAKADRTAGAHGIPHSYRDLSSLLSERRPDVVHVLTPPRTHQAKPYRRFVTLHGTEMSIGADLTNSTLVRFRQAGQGRSARVWITACNCSGAA